MLYNAVTTPRLEPSERAWFLDALEAPPWWNLGRSPIDDAIDETGLDVVAFETRSPEYSEALMAVDPGEISEQLCQSLDIGLAKSRFPGRGSDFRTLKPCATPDLQQAFWGLARTANRRRSARPVFRTSGGPDRTLAVLTRPCVATTS